METLFLTWAPSVKPATLFGIQLKEQGSSLTLEGKLAIFFIYYKMVHESLCRVNVTEKTVYYVFHGQLKGGLKATLTKQI